MKEQLISYDTAVLAKQKGFNWECNRWYEKGKSTWPTSTHGSVFYEWCDFNAMNKVSCPTQSLLQKWLREKHGLLIWLQPRIHFDSKWRWSYYIAAAPKSEREVSGPYDTYENALEDGLQVALKMIPDAKDDRKPESQQPAEGA